MIKYMFILCIICLNLNLAPTSYTAPESVAVGGGGGSGVGKGAPLRYVYTARGYGSFGSWSPSGYEYSMFSIISGSNPLSRLEVVSLLNIPSQAHELYYYSSTSCPAKYAPMVYLGTTQTIALNWLFDRQIYAGNVIKIPENWPINDSQKGEANTVKIIYRKHLFLKFLELLYKAVYFFLQCLNK